jgi:outer membrane protein TolC
MGGKNLAFSVMLVAVGGVFAFAQGPAVRPLTLADCYRIALGTSESVLSAGQVVREARARYQQAVGAAIPHLSYGYSFVHQDITTGASFPSYIAYPDSIKSTLTLTQPLFTGLREYAAIAASRSERLQRPLEELRARQTLLADVTDAFFSLVEQREALKILNDIHAVIQQQVDYLKERESVGRSRRADVASTVVILYQNEALIQSTKGLEVDAVKHLVYVTGIAAVGELDDTTMLPQMAGEKEYTDKAFRRPDVEASWHALEIARKQVAIVRGAYWPNVNFTGNYYLQRTGQFAGIDWDATLSLTLPLLPVVQTIGSVREASAKAEEASLAFELLKRSALTDIQTAYADVSAAAAQQEAFARALAAAEESFKLQAADYRLNLVNNLDVLAAIQSLQGARRDYLHAVYNAKRLYWHLKVAAGETL